MYLKVKVHEKVDKLHSDKTQSHSFISILVIYAKKLLNSDWLRKECKMCDASAKSVIQCKLHIKIMDYDWLINSRVWSGPMTSFVFKSSTRPGWRKLLMAQFFPDCVIHVRFFCLTVLHFFCILLISNHTIWNKLALVNFSKTTKCTCPTGSCTFVGFWKIFSCLLIPNCTWNHVITYTNIHIYWQG